MFRFAIAWPIAMALVACDRTEKPSDQKKVAQGGDSALAPMADAAPGNAIVGMAWIPPGTLKAGTPIDHVPRISGEELPGIDLNLQGFYMDLLPYPNESGAIPTSNVSRDDADKMCDARGKRLCSELEWERACKGDANTTYEYGDVYRAESCGTGIAIDEAAKRPSGERSACKSSFGILEMHGGVWEWTSSPWGRGSTESLGVLRGGNALAGELVGRCANALGRKPAQKSPNMGFRCCKGDKNEALVDLKIGNGRALEPQAKSDPPRFLAVAKHAPDSVMTNDLYFRTMSSWTWRPAANEVLTIASGCANYVKGKPEHCMLIVFRDEQKNDVPLASINVDVGVGEVALAGDARHVRIRAIDTNGALYGRAITYVYGRVDIAELKTK